MFRRFHFALALAALACAGLAPAAHASITAASQPIVDRYVAATGGRAALDAEHSLRVKGRLNTLELRGSFENFSQMPDKVVERLTLGTMRMLLGYDGATGWSLDMTSKKAAILSGKELEKIQGEAYFMNEMWARPGQGGGRVIAGPSAIRSDDEYCSLEITPPAGPPRKLWFSVRTGLLVRSVASGDNAESRSWFTEHTRVAGRIRPGIESAFDPEMHLSLTRHDDQDTEQAFADSVWANVALDSTRFSPPVARDPGVQWAKQRGVAVLPFRYGSSHVWLRASINGAPPADFILDTGASMSVIDRQYAEEIGLGHEGAAGVQGMGGEGSISFSHLGSIRIGGVGDAVTLRDVRVGLTDLADTDEPLVWRRMCGLIGYDILNHFVVEIDYDRRLVTLRDPKDFVYTGKGQAIDMQLAHGVPIVRVKLDDACEGDFLVDVGNAAGVLLHGSLVRKCQLFDTVRGHKQLEMYTGGIGDAFMSWITRIDKLAIGPFEVPKPIVGLALGTHGMVGSQDYAGNLGSNLLEQFVCTFDYDRRKLYLEPGKKYGSPSHYSRSGSMFLRFPHRVVVASILRGSAADEAGLELEDEITAIDTKPAMSFTAEDMDRTFDDGEPGATHTLTIMRDGKSKTVTMTLKDAL